MFQEGITPTCGLRLKYLSDPGLLIPRFFYRAPYRALSENVRKYNKKAARNRYSNRMFGLREYNAKT